ncbi:MAG: hypothetical protein J6V09_03260 [Clostridia bacterium]|nr:hypothetical protein [Clostridia bacterium]
MKKDNSMPYRTFSFDKIDAPVKKAKSEPRTNKTVAKTDLRVGGKK